MNDKTAPIPPERKRYFILSPGRAGSTLLSLILADSGGLFYSDKRGVLAPRSGTRISEHPKLNKVSYMLEQALRMQLQHKYSLFYSLYYHKIITYKRFTARRILKRFLESSHYFKNINEFHHTVRLTAHLGYWPVVILNYRNYHTWMGSLYPGQRYQTVTSLTDNYVSALRNGLALLGLFGGCTVSYEELVDPQATGWADALGQATGLAAGNLLENRSRLFKAPGPESPLYVSEEAAERLEARAREFSGISVQPSRVAFQYWGTNPTK